jgi:hypothetical protein
MFKEEGGEGFVEKERQGSSGGEGSEEVKRRAKKRSNDEKTWGRR